ncbi:uncharacterized protein LOC129569694 [Sitodiplosis mosellana]|uniref:uncharacterized protein LOC129569694 n=1 Tax=Sitodiplosis mosellana TaxID=263140 RepID=UPI0024447A8B|nr:uncharacterized protein LOC129569694 [Sitodiplosis mosellana]
MPLNETMNPNLPNQMEPMDVDVPFIKSDNQPNIDELCEKFDKLNIKNRFPWIVLTLMETAIALLIFFLLLFIVVMMSLYEYVYKKGQEIISIKLKLIEILHGNISIPLPKVTTEMALHEIKQLSYLSCEITMNFFTNMVNNIQNKFKMVNPIYFKKKCAYSNFSVDQNDIQILFIYPDKTQKNIGHYIAIYYNADTKIVDIYDSCVEMYTDDQKRDIKRELKEEILDRMYPNNKYAVWKRPKSLQKDDYSCGVFAIAYALLLFQGKKPENDEIPFLAFDTFYLRQFLGKMFEENKLLPLKYLI